MSRMRAPNYHLITRKVTGFHEKRVRYDRPGDGSHDPHAASDLAITKRIAAVLETHYPSHPWMVRVDGAQGIAMISLPIIMKRNQSFVLHLDRLAVDPGMKSVIRAGGEILERYNVPRSGFRLDHFLHARAANPANRKMPRLLVPG